MHFVGLTPPFGLRPRTVLLLYFILSNRSKARLPFPFNQLLSSGGPCDPAPRCGTCVPHPCRCGCGQRARRAAPPSRTNQRQPRRSSRRRHFVVLVPHTSAPESRQAPGAGSIMHDHSHLCWFVDPHCLDGLLQFSPVRYLLVVHRFAFLRLGRSCYIRFHLGGHVRMNKALLYNQLVRMYNSVYLIYN